MKMRLLVVAAVTLLVLAIAPAALAASHSHSNASHHQKKAKPFLCKGSFGSATVDSTGAVTSFTLTVKKGSRVIEKWIKSPSNLNGSVVSFAVTGKTRVVFRIRGSHVGFRKVSDLATFFATLDASAWVHVNGRYDPNTPVFTARLVKVILPATSTTSSTPGT